MSTLTDLSPEAIQLAKDAVRHVLNAIADDPRKFWLLGDGTESYAKLTRAAAAIWGRPVDEIRKDFRPDSRRYQIYCAELEAKDLILRYCQDRGIRPEMSPTVEEMELAL